MVAVLHIVEIIVGIGLIILVHELGHFLAAKWAGVRVDKFALGMGPRLLWTVRGETEYSLRLVPFGGFVAMAGEEPGSVTEAPPERQFRNVAPGKRAVILVAGVFMNFVFGVILFAIVFGIGVNQTQPLVGAVQPGSPAERAGLLPGDEIVALNGDREVDWEDIKVAILMSDAGDNETLTVLRDKKEFKTVVTTRLLKELGLPDIGIEPATGDVVTEVQDNSPASRAGLRVGDRINHIDGTVFYNWPDVISYASERMGRELEFDITRDGKTQTVKVVPQPQKTGWIGVTPAHFPHVRSVGDNSPAAEAGLKVDDEFLAVDNAPTPRATDLTFLTNRGAGKPLRYTIRRKGAVMDIMMTPRVVPGEHAARIGIGIEASDNMTVGTVAPGSPAAKAGLSAGDVLTRVDGVKLAGKAASWGRVEAVLQKEKGNEVTLAWMSGKAPFERTVKVEKKDDVMATCGFLVAPGRDRLRSCPPWHAPVVGFKKSWQVVDQVYLFLRGLVTGRIGADNAAGPVGIFGFSYKVAKEGIMKLLFWLAIIDVNIAVVNLLPLTPFDGGLLVITGFEKLRGRRLSDAWLMRLMLVGWALVIVLLVFITINDIKRFLPGY